jgi:hypothetical protein
MNTLHRPPTHGLYTVAGRLYQTDGVTKDTFLLRDVLDNQRLSINLTDLSAMIEHQDLVPVPAAFRPGARPGDFMLIVDECSHSGQSLRQCGLGAVNTAPRPAVLRDILTPKQPPHQRAHQQCLSLPRWWATQHWPPCLLRLIHPIKHDHGPINRGDTGDAGHLPLTSRKATRGYREMNAAKKQAPEERAGTRSTRNPTDVEFDGTTMDVMLVDDQGMQSRLLSPTVDDYLSRIIRWSTYLRVHLQATMLPERRAECRPRLASPSRKTRRQPPK